MAYVQLRLLLFRNWLVHQPNSWSKRTSKDAEQDSGKQLDTATAERLSRAGSIVVLLHRVKNIRWPRRARPEASEMPHNISDFGAVPEKSMRALGLSHHGRQARFSRYTNCKLTSYSVGTAERKRMGGTWSYDPVDGKGDDKAFAIFNFKYRSLGKFCATWTNEITRLTVLDILKSLGIVRHTPAPELLAPLPQLRTLTAAPESVSRPQDSSTSDRSDGGGLTKEELVAVISIYRGHGDGLSGLSQKELVAVLNHHRVSDTFMVAPIHADRVQITSTPASRVKRERDDDHGAVNAPRKRKPEVIELDD
jgi:hypothetical protein